MDILISFATKIGEGLVESTGLQFGYFIYYNSYIDDLGKQLERLKNKKNDLKISIDEKERNGDIIREEVKKWVEDADGYENEALKLKEEEEKAKKCVRGWFPDLIRRRYRLGKEAKQKTMEVIKLHEVGDTFNTISTPAPPSEQLLMSSSNITIYKTTEDVMSAVMECLKTENIIFIGIHGMGGVGKTTLVKEIKKNVTKEMLFDKTVMVAISQNVDLKNIQDQLADMLGLNWNVISEQGRARRLFDALWAVKKILIILDDVWDTFNHFEAIGIPFGDQHTGCKVIITTRDVNVWRILGSQIWLKSKMVPLNCLSDKESWDLFKKNAPDVTDPELNKIAKEIIKKCGGLPLALVKAGSALRGKNLDDWKVAAQELKKSASMNIPGIDDSVVKCLELSYDKLKQEDAKHLFLLCSLFPEDFDISIADLILYGFGLGIFRKISTVQDARMITKSKIKYLEEVSLLLASGKEGCTKMHIFVRDVALSIRSGKYLVTADHVTLTNWPNMEQQVNNYRGASLMKIEIEGPHPILKHPNLQIMLLQENSIRGTLRVLDMRSTGSNKFGTTQVYEIFHHFVLKVCDLKFLTALILDGTQFMDTSFLGEIRTLEVLSLKDCIFHMELKGVSQLTELRFLDISHCLVTLLDLMPSDNRPTLELCSFEISSSSSFSKLEELYLLSTVISPEFISCLKYMPCLKVLTISIPDFQPPLPREIFLPDQLETFIVSIGSNSYEAVLAPNSLCVLHNLFHGLQNLVHKLYKRTINTLTMGWCKGLKDIFPSLLPFDDGETTFRLKQIEVHKCDDFAYLIDNSEWERNHRDPLLIFSNLNHLVFWRLNSFKGIICNSGWSVALHNLRILEISYCPILKTVLKPSVVSTLDSLEELSVEYCDALEEIVQSENGELESEMTVMQQQQDNMVFRSLKKLDLLNNNHLKAFSLIRSIHFEFPLLDYVSIDECPNMKTFSSGIHSIPNLKEIELDCKRVHPEQGMMCLDLNMVMQNHFKEKAKNIESE